MIETKPNTPEEIIEVVTAFKEGKRIEAIILKREDFWSLCGSKPLWDFLSCRYRVSPEPRKCWVKWESDDRVLTRNPKEYLSQDMINCGYQLVVEEVK